MQARPFGVGAHRPQVPYEAGVPQPPPQGEQRRRTPDRLGHTGHGAEDEVGCRLEDRPALDR